MVTGLNTNVRHGETVYHVQTEDRGDVRPIIETLVYAGGGWSGRRQRALTLSPPLPPGTPGSRWESAGAW